MNLKPLTQMLNTMRLGKLSKTLFMQMMPASCREGILLRAPLTGTTINHELPGFYKGEFQMIVRSTSYEDGEDLAKKVVAALTIELTGTVVGSQTFNYCRPRTLPVAFPLSVGDLIEYNVTFDACYTES